MIWLLLVGVSATVSRAHEISFQLVPEKAWNDGRPASGSSLPAGQIYLFRHGRDLPELVLEANTFGEVPPGDWHWIAEAPGHVSVVGGLLQLPQESESVRKTIIWPVVPACELDLSAARWEGVTRLDAVSLDRNATYPVLPSQRSRFLIPAGRFLVYTLDARGLAAISRPTVCRHGEQVPLRRPEPPALDKQDLMISARLPQGGTTKHEDVLTILKPWNAPEARSSLNPTATVWVADRVTYFFLDVPAEVPWQLVIQTPELLSHRQELASVGGSVRELEDQLLRPRPRVELVVEYRPKRAHARAEIVMSHCGEKPKKHALELEPGECRPVGEPRALQPGTAVYDFRGLDLGWYLLDAWIDDERVIGLGSWLTTFLTPESPEVVELPPQRLEERHIYGHLLQEGESVPGEVRVEPLQPGAEPMRRCPTDEDFLYHLYYFGHDPLPFAVVQLPEDLRERPLAELRGLGFGYQLRACSEDGSCRLFHHRSTFMGEGRFDIELSTERELLVKVLDAREAEPVEGALVIMGSKQKRLSDTLHFVDGEIFVNAESTAEAVSTTSDARGEIRARQLEAGTLRVVVIAEGFRRFEGEVEMPPTGEQELQVELEPEAPRGLLTLRFPGGRPVASAALLALAADGAPDYRCTKASDAFGEVELAPECLEQEGKRFVVLHPQAVIRLVTAAALRRAPELEVEEDRGLPVRARLVDATGKPLPDVVLAMRFADFTLTPNHFLAAASIGSALRAFRTDARGEIALTGVDPRHGLPELARIDGGPWVLLPAALPGEVVELRLEAGEGSR